MDRQRNVRVEGGLKIDGTIEWDENDIEIVGVEQLTALSPFDDGPWVLSKEVSPP